MSNNDDDHRSDSGSAVGLRSSNAGSGISNAGSPVSARASNVLPGASSGGGGMRAASTSGASVVSGSASGTNNNRNAAAAAHNNDKQQHTHWSDDDSSNTTSKGRLGVEHEDEVKIGPLGFKRNKYDAMCNALKVAKWHETRHQLKTISNVMSGEELVAWFMSNGYVETADDAIAIGKFLIQVKVLYPMLKRLAPRGFENTHELFYMLTPEREERNVVQGMFNKAKALLSTDTTQGGSPLSKDPVKYIAEGFHVEAIVYEHERFANKNFGEAMTWSSAHLSPETDPKHFSMRREDVPIPSVGAASPDLCEWIDEWVPIVHASRTDDNGWTYAEGFGSLSKPDGGSASFNVHEHRVRVRAWHRYARKTPEVQQIQLEEEEPETAKEAEERAHKEMLQRIEQARKQRQKYYLQWCVEAVTLNQSVAPSQCFVVVEHFASRQRSNACPQRGAGNAPGTIEFPINECSGQFEVCSQQIVGFAVWAHMSLGRKQQIGYASFCVPDRAVFDLTVGTADVVDKEGKEVGNVKFDWTLQPTTVDNEDYLNDSAQNEQRASTVLHTPHCVLELSIVDIHKVDERIVDRGRGSRFKCLAFFMPSGEPKAFLRIKYRGLVSNMTLESSRIILTETCKFDFSTFLAVRHLIPVTVEVWYERGSPGKMTQELIGEIKLEFSRSGLEVVKNDQPVPASSELARRIHQAALAALPAEAKPSAPSQPANPILEELISYQNDMRKSQQHVGTAQTGTLYTPAGEENVTNSAAMAAAAAAAADGGAAAAASATATAEGDNKKGDAVDGLIAAVGAADKTKTTPITQVLPTVITNACQMMIRYKYIVEGESDGTILGAANSSAALAGGAGGNSASAADPPPTPGGGGVRALLPKIFGGGDAAKPSAAPAAAAA